MRSSRVGGRNPFGCLVDAARLMVNWKGLVRERPTWRIMFVIARAIGGVDMLVTKDPKRIQQIMEYSIMFFHVGQGLFVEGAKLI